MYCCICVRFESSEYEILGHNVRMYVCAYVHVCTYTKLGQGIPKQTKELHVHVCKIQYLFQVWRSLVFHSGEVNSYV